jgi:uncharacterized membrane protein
MIMRRVLIASLILSIAGTVVGAYLIRVHYDMDTLVCGTGDCEVVQTSEYATLMDIPIAVFGTAMYVAVLGLTLLRLRTPQFFLPASTAALAITAAGTLYSGWLTWIEIYELEAICQWCVVSATLTTLLFILEIVIFARLWSEGADDEEASLET